MSAIGTKRTCQRCRGNVRFRVTADMPGTLRQVRLWIKKGHCRAPFVPMPSHRPLFTLHLGAVHYPARIWIKRVASMHSAAVVPHDEIADAPDVLPGKPRCSDDLPQLVETRR